MSSVSFDAADPARLAVLDTVPRDEITTAALAELVELAAFTAHTPMAAVSFLEADRACCATAIGIDIECVDSGNSFAATTLAAGLPHVVSDTREHDTFASSSLVTGETGVRFYAGFPLKVDGHGLGTLFVADKRPRHLPPDEAHALRVIADQASAQLKLAQLTRGSA